MNYSLDLHLLISKRQNIMENQIGIKIKELRLSKGFSQEELAEKAGLSARTIQRIENQENIPMGDTVRRIAESLGVGAEEILDWNLTRNRAYEIVMILSTLFSVFYPVIGLVLVVVMWVIKKNEYKNIDNLGRKLISFELTVLILFVIVFIGNALVVLDYLNTGLEERSISGGRSLKLALLSYYFVSGLKALLMVMNAIYYRKNARFLFLPRFKFFA